MRTAQNAALTYRGDMCAPHKMSRCDEARAVAAAVLRGDCAGDYAALCRVPQAANDRMALFASRFNPANLFKTGGARLVVEQTQRNYASAIADAPPLGWSDFEGCEWNTDGSPGGPHNRATMGREDLVSLGMSPTYPLGGHFAENFARPLANAVPVVFDYVMNPGLAVILFLAVVGVVLALLARGLVRMRRASAEKIGRYTGPGYAGVPLADTADSAAAASLLR